MLTQYQAGRKDSESPVVSAIAGGSTTAPRTLWIGLQKRNRAGYNRISSLTQVTVNTGQRLSVTIPASVRATGEGWIDYVVVAALSNSKAATYPIARISALTVGGAPIALPTTILLSTDDDLAIAPTVATPAALPATPQNGAVRGVTSTNLFYEFRLGSTATADGTNVLTATGGRWHYVATPGTHIVDTAQDGGSDAELGEITAPIIPIYDLDVSGGTASPKVTLWVVNNAIAGSGVVIDAGRPVRLQIYVNGALASQAMEGLVRFTFDGYVDTSTGVLNTAVENAGATYTHFFRGNGFFLPEDVLPGQAVQLSVVILANNFEANGILSDGATVEVRPDIYTLPATFNPAGQIIGDRILPDGDRRRLVPSSGLTARALSGAVNLSYSTTSLLPPQMVPGLAGNTANQTITINSNGDCRVLPSGGVLTATEVKRAVIGTLAGESNPVLSSTLVLPASRQINVTVNHSNTTGFNGIVRGGYPDVVASMGAYFNPPTLRVYLRRSSDNAVRYWSAPVSDAESQAISISTWASGTAGTIPANVPGSFSLYEPVSVAIANAAAGGLAADTYQAFVSYVYDGSQITSISHSVEQGCIPEFAGLSDGIGGLPMVYTTTPVGNRNGRIRYDTGTNVLSYHKNTLQGALLLSIGANSQLMIQKKDGSLNYKIFQLTTTPLILGDVYSASATMSEYGTIADGDEVRLLISLSGPPGQAGANAGHPCVWDTATPNAAGEIYFSGTTLVIRDVDRFNETMPLDNVYSGSIVRIEKEGVSSTYRTYQLTTALTPSGSNYSAAATVVNQQQPLVQGDLVRVVFSRAGVDGSTVGIPMIKTTGAVDADGEHGFATGTLTIRGTAQDTASLAAFLPLAIAGSVVQFTQRSNPLNYELYALTTSMTPASGNYSAAATQVIGGSAIAAGTPTYMAIFPRGSAGANGVAGGQAMVFETGTVDGNGKVGFAAGTLTVRNADRSGASLTNLLGGLPSGSSIQIVQETDANNRVTYVLSGALTLTGSNYSATATQTGVSGSLADGVDVRMIVLSRGPAGQDGATAGQAMVASDATVDANGEVLFSGGTLTIRGVNRDGVNLDQLLTGILSGSHVQIIQENNVNNYRTYALTSNLTLSGSNYSATANETGSGSISAGVNLRMVVIPRGAPGNDGITGGQAMIFDAAVDAAGEVSFASNTLTIRNTDRASASLTALLDNLAAGSNIQLVQESNIANRVTYVLGAALTLTGSNYSATAVPAGVGGAIPNGQNIRMFVAPRGGTGLPGADGVGAGLPMVATTGAVDANGEHGFSGGILTLRATAQDGVSLAAIMAGAIAGSTIQISQRNAPANYEIYALTAAMTLAAGNYTATATQVLGGSAIAPGTPTQLIVIPRGAQGNPGAGSSVTVREVDGTPSGSFSTIEVPNGSLTDQGGGVARLTWSTALPVQDDGVAAEPGATLFNFEAGLDVVTTTAGSPLIRNRMYTYVAETLLGDRTLVAADPFHLFLNSGTSDRLVIFPVTPVERMAYRVVNTGTTNNLNLRETAGGSNVLALTPGKWVEIHYFGGIWRVSV